MFIAKLLSPSLNFMVHYPIGTPEICAYIAADVGVMLETSLNY